MSRGAYEQAETPQGFPSQIHTCIRVRTDGCMSGEVDEPPVAHTCMSTLPLLRPWWRWSHINDVGGLEVAVHEPQAVEGCQEAGDVP